MAKEAAFKWTGTVVLLWAAGGCDAGPGPSAVGNRPPEVSQLVYSPQVVDLDDEATPYVLEDGHVEVPLAIQVEAEDPEGGLSHVAYAVQAPGAGSDAVSAGTLARDEQGAWAAETVLELPIGAVGTYQLLVFAVDEQGRPGNQVRGSLRFIHTGSPPVIEAVAVEPAVIRPPATVRLTATVSDPEGLLNVARVEARGTGGIVRFLRDEGLDGDEGAGDGLFTVRFDVPAAAPGIQAYVVRAFDRAGLASEAVVAEVGVE